MSTTGSFQDLPIRRKVTAVIMLTSVSVLLLTIATFVIYDVITYRQTLLRNLSAKAGILAGHSSHVLAARDEREADDILQALRTDPDIAVAAIYDHQGRLFASVPTGAVVSALPTGSVAGQRFAHGRLTLLQPITRGSVNFGTLYLQTESRSVYQRLALYLAWAFLVLLFSLLVALALSQALQRRITGPLLALAEAARTVSERGDFSVRAPQAGRDEVGALTEAFNEMLKRIQEAEAARSFLAAIVESSDAAIVGKDLEGKVVSWNAGAERLFGFSAAEMIGQPITRLISPDRPDEESRILKDIRQGGIRHYETVRLRKDGQPIEIALTASPIKNARGQIIGLSSVSRDITERTRAERELKESRARFSGIIGSAMDAIISVDAGQRITIFNAAAELMFGCSASEALGQPLDRFIPPGFRQAHHQEVENFGRTGVTSRAMGHLRPLAGLRANGEEFGIEASISQIEVGGQKVYTVILRDITERQKAQQQIRDLNLELEQRVEARTAELRSANAELEAFTYSVAHDLRAPLRHIDAFSKILADECSAALTGEAVHFLKSIRSGSRHMSQLIDDLLNLARVRRTELSRKPTPLARLAAEAWSDLKPETEGRQIRWALHELPVVDCDPGLMKQVFVNLLSNAIKYTRPRAEASVEAGWLDMNGSSVIYVRDNGVGFNMKYADKLFGVFQRLHRAEEFEGTGVGLATVDRIIRKHGGCIWAEAAIDKGTVFYFTIAGLPLKP